MVRAGVPGVPDGQALQQRRREWAVHHQARIEVDAVEESAAAAQSLRDQAQRLAAVAARFAVPSAA
jgi:prephenate dehydratase